VYWQPITRRCGPRSIACDEGNGQVLARSGTPCRDPAKAGRTRYEVADTRIRQAIDDLLGLVLAVDPAACPDAADRCCC
jgi:hypothetical protein